MTQLIKIEIQNELTCPQPRIEAGRKDLFEAKQLDNAISELESMFLWSCGQGGVTYLSAINFYYKNKTALEKGIRESFRVTYSKETYPIFIELNITVTVPINHRP